MCILRVYYYCVHLRFSIDRNDIECTHFPLHIGFNKFMEDIRMMLDRRPLEPYWFFTWCISGPIITLVRHQSTFVYEESNL